MESSRVPGSSEGSNFNVCPSGQRREPMAKPRSPPPPALQHLTDLEMDIIHSVMSKQEQFQDLHTASVLQLKKDLKVFEENVNKARRSRRSIAEENVCRLCGRTQLSKGTAHTCDDCRRKVCSLCGSFTKAGWDVHSNKFVREKWCCHMCQKKREILMATGMWYHGDEAHPTLDSSVFNPGSVLTDTDRQTSAENTLSDSFCSQDVGQVVNSDNTACLSTADPLLNKCRPYRRLHSHDECTLMPHEEEEDPDVNDEEFFRERRRSRQERLKAQKKTGRRRHRRTSVGTSTQDDDFTGESGFNLVECPMHGLGATPYPPTQASKERKVSFSDENKALFTDSKTDIARLGSAGNLNVISCSNKKFRKGKSDTCLLKFKNPNHYGLQKNEKFRELTSIPSKRYTTNSPYTERKFEHELYSSDFKGRQKRLIKVGNHSVTSLPGSDRRPSSSIKTINVCNETEYVKRVSADSQYKPITGIRKASLQNKSKGMALSLRKDTMTEESVVLSCHSDFSTQEMDSALNYSNSETRNVPHMPNKSHSDFEKCSFEARRLDKRQSRPYIRRFVSVEEGLSPMREGDRTEDFLCTESETHESATSSCISGMIPDQLHSSLGSQRPESQVQASRMPSPHYRSAEYHKETARTTDEVSFVGLPRFLANPITEEDQCKQEHLLHPLSKASFRKTSHGNTEKVTLCKNPNETNCRTHGFGMVVMGGKLGEEKFLKATVAEVRPGGAADTAGICVGDEILEWDGCSLRNITHEQTKKVIESSNEMVHLVIMYDSRQMVKIPDGNVCQTLVNEEVADQSQLTSSDCHKGRDHDDCGSLDVVKHKSVTLVTSTDDSSKLKQKAKGQVEVVMKYKKHTQTLGVHLLQTKDIRLTSTCMLIIRLRLLPLISEGSKEHFFTSEDVLQCVWNNCVVYKDFSPEKMAKQSLEITVWSEEKCQGIYFIGEILLDLDQAKTEGEQLWYYLQNHDENNGELFAPERVAVNHKYQFITPKKEDLASKSMVSIFSVSDRESRTNSGLVFPECHDSDRFASAPDLIRSSLLPRRRESSLVKLRRRLSDAISKVGTRIIEKRSQSLDSRETSCEFEALEKVANSTNTFKQGSNIKLAADDVIKKKSFSSTESNSSDDSDIQEMSSLLRQAPDGDDMTSVLGPAQINTKDEKDDLLLGDIRLGFFVTKGQLEIDVICARGLCLMSEKTSPDTYVKTSLCGNGKRFQKRKTAFVKCNTNPVFRDKVKYSACNIYGRLMQIQLKQKKPSFERNPCLGEVVVNLDGLDLSRHTLEWYKLLPKGAVELGSTDSL